MSEIHSGAIRWLTLAAAPTFAIMALTTAVLGGGPTYMICSAEHGSLLSGMVPMYLLMSAFHSPPWLRLISGRSRRSIDHRVPAGHDQRTGTPRPAAGAQHGFRVELRDEPVQIAVARAAAK